MVRREAKEALTRYAEQFPIVAVTGPRQSGIIRLLPISISELRNDNLLSDDPYDYVYKGLYPPLYDENKHFDTYDWFENYIDTYLDLDVKDSINPSNISTFRKFIRICALYSGQCL